MSESLPTGIYQHYKGNDYRVLGTVKHSESEEILVLYQPLYGEGKLWVRPLEMFCETVEVDGVTVDRFKLISTEPANLPLW